MNERDRIDLRIALDRHFRSLIVRASTRIKEVGCSVPSQERIDFCERIVDCP